MRTCLICDDHGLIRDAVAGLVRRKWPFARILQAPDFPTAWWLAAQGPDLCLVDLDMPGAGSLEGVAGIMAAAPETRLLVVSGLDDDDLLLDLLAAGVAGFAPKASSVEVLGAAMELVLAGGRYLPPRLAELAARNGRPGAAPPAARLAAAREPLTARQLEVLKLMAAGQSNKDIARALGLSPATVKTHVAQIIGIIGAANRTEAAARARTLGWL